MLIVDVSIMGSAGWFKRSLLGDDSIQGIILHPMCEGEIIGLVHSFKYRTEDYTGFSDRMSYSWFNQVESGLTRFNILY